jgi:SPP1 gp7 family putative phage head morphogenesis protein
VATDPREVLVRQLFALQQIANTLSDQSDALLRSMFDDIVAEIARLDPTGVAPRYRQGRLDKLAARVREIAGPAFDELYKQQRAALAAVGAREAAQTTMHLRAVLGAGNAGRVAATTGLGQNFFKAVIDTQPVQGALLKDWFAGQKQRVPFQVGRQVQLGMVNGETIDQLVRRVRGRSTGRGGYTGGVMQTTTRETTAIVRTAVNDISNVAHMNTFEANADILKSVTFVATLDSRTSSVCQAADSKTWKLGDPSIQRPPLHVNCRSVLVGDVDWESLGMEPPPEGTRASAGGQVPASTTYEEWLRDQPAAVQDEILGVGRAKLFRENQVGLRELVTTDGRRLPLEGLIDGAPESAADPLFEGRRRVLPRVLEDEAAIVGKRYEYARAWDPETGDRVLFGKTWNRAASKIEHTSGTPKGVEIPTADHPALRGSVMTHNHPSGAPFSPSDLRFAGQVDLYEIRAVGAVNTFSAIRPPGGWDLDALESAVAGFEKDWLSAERRTSKTAHDLWRKHLDRIGVRYTASRTG